MALGDNREQLLGALQSIAKEEPSADAIRAKATEGKLAYLFTGQGSQRAGMGKDLYESHPAFKAALDEVLAELDPQLDRPLKELLFAEPGSPEAELLDHTSYAQPAIFALQVALFEALGSQGLTPDLLTGHSIGEISAAQLSGVLSLADAAKLVAARGRLMGELPEGGAMVAIEATEAEAKEAIAGKEQELSIAAINAPRAIVLSGAEQPLKDLAARFSEQGRKTKELSVSHAFHSALMEPMLEDFAEVASSLTYNQPQIPIVSNTTGEILSPEQATDPAYWVAHVRQAVRFADAVATLQAQGASAYLELGPDAVLTAMASSCLEQSEKPAALIPTLREGRPEPRALAGALAEAHAAGAKLDWEAFFEGAGARRVALPTYAFGGERYWLVSGSGVADANAVGQSDPDHPLLGAVVEDAGGEGLTLTGRLSLQSHPWLADHAIAETVLLPGTAFLELALAAAERVGAGTVEELTIEAPLTLPERGAVSLQLSLAGPDEQGRRELAIHSRPEGDAAEKGEWTRHASGALAAEASAAPEPLRAWPPEGAQPLEVEDLYERFADVGLDYGPAFQGLSAAWVDGEEIYAEISLPEEHSQQAQRFGLHPALLDAALHAAAVSQPSADAELRLPFSWSGVSLHSPGATQLRVKLTREGEESVSLSLANEEGAAVASVGSLALRAADPSLIRGTRPDQDGLLAVGWKELELGEPAPFVEVEDLTLIAGEDTGAEPPQLVLWRPAPGGGADVAGVARALAQGVVEQLQGWLSEERLAGSRLALLTKGAVATREGEGPDTPSATLWGLLRSAQAEHPGRFVLIDSDDCEASRAATGAALALEEPQLALREGVALAPRLAPAADGDSLIPPAGPWHLDALERGTLESLALVPGGAAAPLGPTEVRISMRAAGLNFRDVLIALGVYPGAAPLGSEGAGVVVEVGAEVTDLGPGERVMGMFSNAFGPLAIAERHQLAPIPDLGWSFEQAAAVPEFSSPPTTACTTLPV